MIDFTKILNDSNINIINDLMIEEKIKKNTIIIDYNDKKHKEYILQNYIDYKNYIASFIKSNYCFNIFCRYFTLYKNNNINLEYNAIKSKIDFLKDTNNKRLINICFNNNTMDSLYNLFLSIKNDR